VQLYPNQFAGDDTVAVRIELFDGCSIR